MQHLSILRILHIRAWVIHYFIPTESFSSRPFLYRTPINHLVGAEYKWTLHHSWSAGWAAGMRVDPVNSGRSVKTVQLRGKTWRAPLQITQDSHRSRDIKYVYVCATACVCLCAGGQEVMLWYLLCSQH